MKFWIVLGKYPDVAHLYVEDRLNSICGRAWAKEKAVPLKVDGPSPSVQSFGTAVQDCISCNTSLQRRLAAAEPEDFQ